MSEHFTLAEATASETALRMGIDNQPNAQQLKAIAVAQGGMERVREVLGHPVSINSWLRVEALERVLTKMDYTGWCKRHGKPVNAKSWAEYFARKGHPKGYAIDFTCPSFGTPAEIVEAIKKSGIKFDQLICEGTWVHISFAPEMRQMVMIATFTKGKVSYEEVANA